MSESRPSDRCAELGAEHRRVTEKLRRLEDVIGELEAGHQRPVEVALLAKYRDSRARLEFERESIASEILRQNRDREFDAVLTALSDQMLDRVREVRAAPSSSDGQAGRAESSSTPNR